MATTARCRRSPTRASCVRTYASTFASGVASRSMAACTSAAHTGMSTSQSSSTTAPRERKYSYTEDRASPVRSASAGKVRASVPPSDSRDLAASRRAPRCIDRCSATEAARILGTFPLYGWRVRGGSRYTLFARVAPSVYRGIRFARGAPGALVARGPARTTPPVTHGEDGRPGARDGRGQRPKLESFARSCRTDFVWIWLTLLSVTPRTWPISARVRPS